MSTWRVIAACIAGDSRISRRRGAGPRARGGARGPRAPARGERVIWLLGQPVACLFHEALGHRLEGERLVARGETRTFASRIGERILPEGLDVHDDPTMRCPETGAQLYGSFEVDAQGMPARRVDLVENGVLRGFLQSRAPIPGSAVSNGHARHDGVRFPMARMGNRGLRSGGCRGAGARRPVRARELAREANARRSWWWSACVRARPRRAAMTSRPSRLRSSSWTWV